MEIVGALIIGLVVGGVIAYLIVRGKQALLTERVHALEGELTNLRSNEQIARDDKTKAETLLSAEKLRVAEKSDEVNALQGKITDVQNEVTGLREQNARLTAENTEVVKRLKEQQEFIQDSDKKLREAFDSLSKNALASNSDSFLKLAKQALETQVTEAKGDLDQRKNSIEALVKPLGESLHKFETKINDLEQARVGAYTKVEQVLLNMQGSTDKLQKEANSLVTALKTSNVRGRYGEIALRRLVEFSGMNNHVDFQEQVSVNTEEGRLRPDLIVNLPGGKSIVVDSKVPLSSYMKAFETTEEVERVVLLKQHAIAVRGHLKTLSGKTYWNQFRQSPDYVVLYLPIESSFGAALEYDPELIEDALNGNVIIATPTTLITLLKTVAFSWQQLVLADNVEKIREAGVEMYKRAARLIETISEVGTSLNTVVKKYNIAVGSLEGNFLPQARRMKQLAPSLMQATLEEPAMIDNSVREQRLTVESWKEENPELLSNEFTNSTEE
jgi:DNA recombination protein RmuC